jgi:hypothetical protein
MGRCGYFTVEVGTDEESDPLLIIGAEKPSEKPSGRRPERPADELKDVPEGKDIPGILRARRGK